MRAPLGWLVDHEPSATDDRAALIADEIAGAGNVVPVRDGGANHRRDDVDHAVAGLGESLDRPEGGAHHGDLLALPHERRRGRDASHGTASRERDVLQVADPDDANIVRGEVDEVSRDDLALDLLVGRGLGIKGIGEVGHGSLQG